MKMAKASTADIEMALELSQFVEDLMDGTCPKQACSDPESDDIEWLEDGPDEQHLKIIAALINIARKGSIFRVTFGMSVLIDPRNELIDPTADTLEPHPKFEALAEVNTQLTEALVLMAEELNIELSSGGRSPFSAETTLKARAAIAKATGVTP